MLAISHARRRFGRRTATWQAGRVLALIVALMLVLVGCGGDDEEDPGGTATGTAEETPEPGEAEADEPPEEPVTIRIAYGTPGQEGFYVMQEFPEVAPNLGTWYEVEWTNQPPGPRAQAFAGGLTDGGSIASLAAANLIDQGVDLVLTGVGIEERAPNEPVTWLVRSDSGITSAADLAGQTVGTIGEGTFADHVANVYIRDQGGLELGQDYQKTILQFPVMMDALLSGQIATGPFPSPFLQQALATGEVEPLFVTHDVQEPLVITVTAFRREFVDENQVAVQKFVEDWATVYEWIADPANRDQVIEATSAVTEIPAEALEPYLLTEEDGYRPPNGSIDQEALQATWDFFREEGAFSQELNVADHVVDDLLPPQE